MTEEALTDTEQAVSEGEAFEVIRKRLEQQGQALQAKIDGLNASRAAEFGQTELKIIGRVRVRTENNCVPRDMVRVGQHLMLFGYNVFLGLKQETQVEDVFSLYKLVETEDGLDVEPQNPQHGFLHEASFVADFQELYRYYKNTRLLSLHVSAERLLAVFQIGLKLEDIRVFRWQIDDDKISYIDNRGERDLPRHPAHDFEWTPTRREDHVAGKHPHVSILDQVFVETVGGDLTVKVENNTEDGLGIYREPVEDQHQSLADADIAYAKLGTVILLKIRPYRENDYRFLVFNTLTQSVERIDAIGFSCVQLPEDHGLIFPGGYYLQNGETKVFENLPSGLSFAGARRSPNGEDVLYRFYGAEAGVSVLFSYNLIGKSLQNPIVAHGVCLFNDGRLLVFRDDNKEAGRIHAMQIWETPYFHEEYLRQQSARQSFFGKIGNAELVRGISDGYSLIRAIQEKRPNVAHYEAMIAAGQRLFDAYHWLEADEVGAIGGDIRQIVATAELVLDEFEKVESIRQQANQALAEAESRQLNLLQNLYVDSWKTPQEFVQALGAMHQQQGRLATIKELRHIDQARVQALQDKLAAELESLGRATVVFLSSAAALQPFHASLAEQQTRLEKCQSSADIQPLLDELEKMGQNLDLLNGTLAGLEVEDPQVRTGILEALSEIYANLNQLKAEARHKRKSFRSGEAVAEFAAQFKLFAQSIGSALESVESPQQCDDQLARLLTQLEDLESRFADFDEFLADIVQQREQLFEAFQSRKQVLLDEIQRRVQNIVAAADRLFGSIERRLQSFDQADALNSFLAADPMVLKLRQLIAQLQALEASVQADEAQSRLKAMQDQAMRALRDRQDIFEEGGTLIKLGKHKFSVNTQPLDLTLIKRQEQLVWHLVGTDYYAPADYPQLVALKDYWSQALVSETAEVYRGEYLAASLLHAAEQGLEELSLDGLHAALLQQDELTGIVRRYAGPRYQEGYDKGIHDADACKILERLLPAHRSAGPLRYTPDTRALALVFWRFGAGPQTQTLQKLAQSAALLQKTLGSRKAHHDLIDQLAPKIAEFNNLAGLTAADPTVAADYLLAELAATVAEFVASQAAETLVKALYQHLDTIGHRADFELALQQTRGAVEGQWQLCYSWLSGISEQNPYAAYRRFVPEAVMLILGGDFQRKISPAGLDIVVENLMGEHPRIQDRRLVFGLDEFGQRLQRHRRCVVPGFQQFQALRQDLIAAERELLRLERYRAKPLTSFVRNRLIDEVYLPLVGDNLAKQMGAAGSAKRTDLMGLLLLISPPGYGKTTLMEYIGNRLGLVFMKIDCPALGHGVHSLDPGQAANATAAKELEKLNLALEMGNNVMLYLDDIQHTHAEFLQKFISLCDGSRRIEGVWRGKTKSYDMRGKKFCVVMAGNPYTESGEVFKIPDMLANRADIYNLGDVLSGNEAVFALSFIENALTSNPVLQGLAMRGMADVYRFIRRAQGESVSDNEFEHRYAAAESREIAATLEKMLKIRDVVLAVNRQYIYSAAQDDRYRSEPPFKLQGSYRNMNKMAEKVTAVMNDEELQNLIGDHYAGEAQTLTRGTEENLLKLKEIRGVLTAEETARWRAIKDEYSRLRKLGDDNDPARLLANQLSQIGEQLALVARQLQSPSPLLALNEQIARLRGQIAESETHVQVVNQPVPGVDEVLRKLADLYELSFLPVFSAMQHKISMEQDTWERVKWLAEEFAKLKPGGKIGKPT
ncbi:DNA repair ATPase [Methylomonas sp. SURF-2]|uniref:DNA repair ATPase n=1 Tax=Methylomonas subterranea TaxID=2952225 RepID=A0ABT1TEY1_9GAMM|nr:DNA repair ATPase [Methylomonas sp. SURF-2]MCQ8104020.1 DNA repair ATPase [Methylomonas sp. SURF-2]